MKNGISQEHKLCNDNKAENVSVCLFHRHSDADIVKKNCIAVLL